MRFLFMEIKNKEIIGKVFLLFISLLLSFLFIEGITRILICDNDLWMPDKFIGMIHIHEKRGCWFSRYGEFKTKVAVNKQGFVDDEFFLNKTNQTLRIAVLGDSYMEGLQVEKNESFSSLLEEELKEGGNRNIEVYNFGISDFGTAQEYEVLLNYALQYKPDIILLGFHTGTDFIDNSFSLKGDIYRPYYSFNKTENVLVKKEFQPREKVWWKKVFSWSRFLEYSYRQFILKKEEYKTKTNEFPKRYGIYQEYDTIWNESIIITELLHSQLQETATKNNATLIIVVLTNPEQIESVVLRDDYRNYPKLSTLNISLNKPENILSDICQRQNLSCFFLLPSFLEYKNKTDAQLHFYYDGHWTKEGHSLAAHLVSRYLKDNFI